VFTERTSLVQNKNKVQIGSVLNSFFLSFHLFVLGVGDYGWNKGDGMHDGCAYIYSALQCRDISWQREGERYDLLTIRVCMCEAIGAPSKLRLIHGGVSLARMLPTFDLSCEKKAARRKRNLVMLCMLSTLSGEAPLWQHFFFALKLSKGAIFTQLQHK
jgi:hypothetical protein